MTDIEPSNAADSAAGAVDGAAERVVLSFPGSLSDRTRDRIRQEYYRTYLRRVLGAVTEGDVLEEFTDVGCCGSQIGVRFVVECVEGAGPVGPATELHLEARPVTDEEPAVNPWSVQNEIDGPEGD